MQNNLAIRQVAKLVDVPASAGVRAVISAFSEQFVAMAPQLAEDQVALFDIVFMEIMRGSDVDGRVLLAERLARVPNAPPRLVDELAADDEIRVAGPILRQSQRITPATLLNIVSRKGEAHHASVAMRQHIPQDICDALANGSSPTVLIILVNNPGARFDGATRHKIIQKSFGNPDLFVAVDRHTEFGKAIMAAYETGGASLPKWDADAEVAGFIGSGQIDRALAIIAMEARTRHRVAMHAYHKDTLESFVIIARAANLSWGTMVGLLLNQFGISVSANQINDSRRLFDDTTRREALGTTRILGMADKSLRG